MKNLTAFAGFRLAIILSSFILISGCKKSDDFIIPDFKLSIISTSPESHETAAPYDDNVSVQLNTALDTFRFSPTFVITQNDSAISGEVIVEGSKISFVTEEELLPVTEYVATISFTEKGKPSSPFYTYQWTFTTKAPDEYSMTKRSDEVTDGNRDGTRCMQIGDYLYSFGGWTDNGAAAVYNDVYRSRGDLSQWEKRADAPWHGRHVYGIAKIADSTYIVGGDPWLPMFDVWRTVDGENWKLLSENVLDNRVLYGCAAHNGFIYVAGGIGHNDVWRSRNGADWEQMATGLNFLKGENLAGSLISFNGKLWVVCGGGDGWGGGTPRNQVWSSTDGKSWKQEKDFAGSSRYYTDVCVWDNKLWVIGGYNYTEGNVQSIWYMQPNGRWKTIQLPATYSGRHATGVAVYNNMLTLTCGSYINDCWVIEKVK